MSGRKRHGNDARSFREIVREVRATPATDPFDGRSVNRVANDDIWDEQGLHWTRDRNLIEEEARAICADPDVRFGNRVDRKPFSRMV